MKGSVFLAFALLGSTAHAVTTDYMVARDPNGFNIYQVQKDTLAPLPAGPFANSSVQGVASNGNLVYAVMNSPVAYRAIQITTYTVESVTQVAQTSNYTDTTDFGSYAFGCSFCSGQVASMYASPQHLFVANHYSSSSQGGVSVSVFKANSGVLIPMCKVYVLASASSGVSPTSYRVDSNDFYAYIGYVDPSTMLPNTAVYDISTAACKLVGTMPQ